MAGNDTRILATIEDRITAEDMQRILEEASIYTMLESDNPASSALNAYTGSHPAETVKLVVNINDFDKAKEVLSNSPYIDLIE